jgi:hypothetical protein
MSREARKKASDVFKETNFLLGEKTTFEKAFPTIANLRIEVREEGDGVTQALFGPKGPRVRVLDAKSAGEFVNCSNPLCYNGGISIGDMIRSAVTTGATEFEEKAVCQGYEGSPKGRRKYQSCINYFRVKGSITYESQLTA